MIKWLCGVIATLIFLHSIARIHNWWKRDGKRLYRYMNDRIKNRWY